MTAEKPPEINSLHDVLDAAEHAGRGFSQREFVWWRGQSSAAKDWRLTPKVYRPYGFYPLYEQNLAARFRLRARVRYPNCPEDRERDRWLYLMQHYGLPTRLLDWTESVLFATFFAVRKHDNGPATLWALDPSLLNKFQTGLAGLKTYGDPLVADLFKPPFHEDAPQKDNVVAVFANQVDFRMLVQLSAFTIHGIATPLEGLKDNDKFLIKFDIPASAKNRLREELLQLGIRESNLFPDLEHLAKDVAAWKPPRVEVEERPVEPPS